jgi:hypothetical protein
VDQESTWSNPAKISRKVRELAHQSHRALKTVARPHVLAPKEFQDRPVDLYELRNQVARLQQTIHARRLGVLVPWVDALRQRIEDLLASAEKRAGAKGADGSLATDRNH